MCVHSLSFQPKFSCLQNACHLLPDIILATCKPIKLLLLLLFLSPIFPEAMRGPCKIRTPQHHFLIKGVRLNGEVLTRFGSMIVWDGDDGADGIFRARDGFTSEDMRVGVVEDIATLTKEGESKDAVINVEFQHTSVSTNRYILETQWGPCDQ